MLERLMDLSIKVGSLKEHRVYTNKRLDQLEQRQSALSIEITTLKASTKTTEPTSLWSRKSAPDKPLIRHTQRFLPRILGWIAEKAFATLLPYLLPLALSAWAIIHRYGELLASWLTRGWGLLFG